jgi:endogenous inhibitor of DNA gyrase (YacG/DUF329 family)
MCQATGNTTAGFIKVRKNGKLEGDMKSRCPVCRKVMNEAGLQNSREGGFYPFCGNRCRMIDLGKWFDGDYRIPAAVKPEEETGEEATNGDKAENG